MRKLSIVMLAIILAAISNCAFAQQRGFINIENGNLTSRLATARQQAHSRAASTPAHSYWIAYGFPVRPNVGVDVAVKDAAGDPGFSGAITGNVGAYETRNLGIFLLFSEANDTAKKPVRAEVYNLDRQRDYDGLPVYWLGRASASESFPLLTGLINQTGDNKVAENLTQAIALHDDPQAENILQELARKNHSEAVRVSAISWLGRLGWQAPLLSALAGDATESLAVRQAAVRAIGKGAGTQAVAMLRELYGSVNDRSVKEEIIDSAAKSHEHDAAVEFLTQVTQSEQNPELSGLARARLEKVTGEKQRRKAEKRADKSLKSKTP
jgi:hypothetical protein